MTLPRQHLPEQMTFMTRCVSEDRNFLRPGDFINHAMAFDLGRAATKHGQSVHGAMIMSNHIHVVITDRTGERSNMARDWFASIGRALNKFLKRRGQFWESGTFNDCVLLDEDALERKLIYTWLNPVRAGLVSDVEDWPGFMILPRDWGKTIQIPRPDSYYGDDSPELVEFTAAPPPGYEHWPLEKTIAHFEERLRCAQAELLAEREAQGLPQPLGVEKILTVDPFSSPTSKKPLRSSNPCFATLDGELMRRAKATRRAFLESYAKQRSRWRKGMRNGTFPCGTIALRQHSGVRCAPTPEDCPLTQLARIARIRREAANAAPVPVIEERSLE